MISPITYLAVAFVLVLLAAGVGTYYFTQVRGQRTTTEQETEQPAEEEPEQESEQGGDDTPLSGSAESMQVTPSGRQSSETSPPPGAVQLEVVGTREDNALGTIITAEVKQGSLSVGDTIAFNDVEGRIGTLSRQDGDEERSVDEASEGDTVSFSLIGVEDVSVEEGMLGERQ